MFAPPVVRATHSKRRTDAGGSGRARCRVVGTEASMRQGPSVTVKGSGLARQSFPLDYGARWQIASSTWQNAIVLDLAMRLAKNGFREHPWHCANREETMTFIPRVLIVDGDE